MYAVRVLLALFLVPVASWAADGDCSAPYRSGEWEVVECFLCDGDHSATDCAEFDLEAEAQGVPAYWVADLAATTGCSGAPSVAVRGLSAQLGVPHVYADLTTAGTSSVVVEGPRHRHLDADVDITTSAGCSDLEVLLRLFYRRVNP